MPDQGPTLRVSDVTLRSLNLKLVKVTYSKPVIIPSVWPPYGLLPIVHPLQEFDTVTISRYFLVRPEELQDLESRVDSLETDLPLPPHSVLKLERRETKPYLVLESRTNSVKEANQVPVRYNQTKQAVELLRKIPRIAAFFNAIVSSS